MGRGLILAGDAREPHDPGPPVVTEQQIRDELDLAFQSLNLREFLFDENSGIAERFLSWFARLGSARRPAQEP